MRCTIIKCKRKAKFFRSGDPVCWWHKIHRGLSYSDGSHWDQSQVYHREHTTRIPAGRTYHLGGYDDA